MQIEIDAASVVWLHDRQLRERDWPVLSHLPPRLPARFPVHAEVWRWIDSNHRYNGLLRREQDRARRPDAPASDVAAARRLIDRYNRKRADAVDAIDAALRAGLARVVRQPGALLSSDTAGAMVDRLSVLALQIHHLRACAAGLEGLLPQRRDLMSSLDALLADARAGRVYFKPCLEGDAGIEARAP